MSMRSIITPLCRRIGLGQGAGAGHGAFLVAGGEDQQRLAQGLVQQRQQRLDGDGEEALHVAAAQAIPAAIALVQAQRVAFPQRLVVGHGVGVPGQHQAAGAAAQARQQVELARGDLLQFAGEAQVAQPVGQQLHHRAVGLVQGGLGTAHRRQGEQLGETVFQARQGHGRLRKRCTHHGPGWRAIEPPLSRGTAARRRGPVH
jgi:hypothetical protein